MTRVLLFCLALAACNDSGLPTATIEVDGNPVKVELAITDDTRARGLMYRDSLASGRGMLFMYEESKSRSFWMKNTRIPLSIAFIADNGKIVQISDMVPLDTKSTKCQHSVPYALEMNRGWFDKHDVEVGDKVEKIPTELLKKNKK